MIKAILSNNYFLFAIRIFLAFVFIYAAIVKISDIEGFSQSVYNYKLLPDITVNIIAIILPWIELTAALLLLFGVSSKENALIISSMLIIFSLAIAISLFRGLDIECGCYGTSDGSKIGMVKLVENAGLIILGIILFFYESPIFTLSFNDQKN